MRRLGLALAIVWSASCGGDDGDTVDAAKPVVDGAVTVDATRPAVDAGPPDALVCGPAPVAPEPGAPCVENAECGENGVCLREDRTWPTAGYCVRVCSSDADCGGALCSPNALSGFRVCLARCCGASACERDGMACIDAFMDNDIGALACVPGNPDAHDGDPCEDFGDCNRASICDRNRFNNPGGYCRTIGCTVGDDASCAPGGDGTCRQEPPPFPNQCYDQCTTHADCRQDEGYRCSNGAAGATAGAIPDAAAPPMPGVCRFAPPKYPGAPCAVDTDCGPAPWECLTGPSFPGGYCGAGTCDPTSIDLSTCPYTATCWGPTPGSEWCVASCGCRTGEGYACVDLGGGATGCLYVGGGGPLDAGP